MSIPETTKTDSVALDAVEAFPEPPATALPIDVPKDVAGELSQARQRARVESSEAALWSVWNEHGRHVIGPLLDNPALPEALVDAIAVVGSDDLLTMRRIRALRAARSVRHVPADRIERHQAQDAASDTARSANDLRILRYRFGAALTVGIALSNNPAVPTDVLEQLARHPSGMVRRAARDRLATRKTGVDVRIAVARHQARSL